MKNKDFIYEYWSKTEFGKRMIKSNNISDYDLLFLIPNNVKRVHGLPATRISGKEKKKQKQQRKRYIMHFLCFSIVENMVEENIRYKYQRGYFDKFVDIKNLNIGECNIYEFKR